MMYATMDKDGNVKTLPLFGDINVCTHCCTFSHPAGLLYATQSAQIALVFTSARPSKTCDRRASCRKIQRSPATPLKNPLLSPLLLTPCLYLLSLTSSSIIESPCNGLSNAMLEFLIHSKLCILDYNNHITTKTTNGVRNERGKVTR